MRKKLAKSKYLWKFGFVVSKLVVGSSEQDTKGHLISKCPFGVIVWTKIPTKFFPGFLSKPLKRGQIKKVE